LPSIPLTWSLPLHVEAGDGTRLTSLFPRVWSRIPAVGRQNLLLAWVEAGPRAMILMRDDLTDGGAGPHDMAACSADGLVIAFGRMLSTG
jgi:hypothetical protein